MSTSSTGADGSPDPHTRVGDAERNAALKALDEHLSDGRLDADEYGDRVAKASVARTREDLEVLFVDLPAPHPWFDTESGAARHPPAPAPRHPPAEASRDQGALGGRAGSLIVALSPFIALALFFATKWWVWFLLIPAVGAIVYSGRHDRRRS